MIIKYRVHEVAKDFDKPSKAVVDLLKNYTDEPRKHMTALEDRELNIIFETFTQETQVENFNDYFALANKVEEEKKPAKAEKAEKKTEKKTEKKSEKKAEKTEKKAEKPKDKKPVIDNEVSRKAAEKQAAREKEKKERAAAAVPQSRTKGEARTVDTRFSHVDLDKYNEKYDDLANTSHNKQNDNMARKQKLKQKSQQYRKQGMRSRKHESEDERQERIARERAKRPQLVIKVPEEITVSELAAMMKMTAAEVTKKLFTLGIMATVNQTIDFDTASIVADELGVKVEKEVVVTIEERIIDDSADDEKDLETRSPVVVVMGHVDHGKTSLLDAIRHTSVTETEAGGITQHIGAYRVMCNGEKITFLDTPGHAAFTSMRARGAQVTDIAILVVAADDGIMPQTIEAINHAKAADVSIIVAINKIDKEGANPDRIKQQLMEHDLVPEEWGGDVICVPVSAKQKLNIDELLENVLLVAEVKELKANPNRVAEGTVIEAKLDKGRGPVATVLVQKGTLHTGDYLIAGSVFGKVRVMINDKGQKIKEAGPSYPVEIVGLNEVPIGGDTFNVVTDERKAKQLVEARKFDKKEEIFNARQKVTLDNLFDHINDGQVKDFNIIVKADVQGSVEAVKQSLVKLSNEEVRLNVIHGGVGGINESDVMLANASNAIIIGFNVRPDQGATTSAEREEVEIRLYRVIYQAIEEMEAAMKGMLAPKYVEKIIGHAEIRETFKISGVGTIAGCYVRDGKIKRNCGVRVVRDNIVIFEGSLNSLKRFKDDAKEVNEGYECGLGIERYNDLKVGDIIECFVEEEVER